MKNISAKEIPFRKKQLSFTIIKIIIAAIIVGSVILEIYIKKRYG